MALQEKLDRFKKQQEKCQSTLVSTKAAQTLKSSSSSSTNGRVTPIPSVKFSNDTERLQHINSIRKAPVGAQMKRVIDLLFETRQALTPDQINQVCYVDMNANRNVFESMRKNPKIKYDGERFSYKSKHDVRDRKELLVLIRKFLEGIAVIDLKDAYPTVMEDLQSPVVTGVKRWLLNVITEGVQFCINHLAAWRGIPALKAAGQIWLLSNFDSQEDIAYPNDPRVPIKVDDDLKLLFRGIELPRDMLDIEKDLLKNGMKPATNTAKRRSTAQMEGIPASKSKPKKKNKEISKRTKLTNVHLPELFQNLKGD
ncbi:hypothetical protein Lal_00025701 [Lupinus albus]|nr:hypothetical protein Lal_00025701 [Lupinus albus]